MQNQATLSCTPTYSDNSPNAARLLSSLRSMDYSNVSAICDIVDNAIDAGATTIRIRLVAEGKKGLQEIHIWDNGFGMDYATLDQAMRLGSDTDKNPRCDLGLYGMGLVTASISIGRVLTVVTKSNQTLAVEATQDLDYICETNKFQKKIQQFDANEDKDFCRRLHAETDSKSNAGTFVVISKIDRWTRQLNSASETVLIESLGQIFRKFIQAGRNIYVNDKLVVAIDPINDFEPITLAEDEIDIDGEIVLVRLFQLKDYGQTINEAKKINIKNQGFYILRNNREITTGSTFGLFIKHNDFNCFRGELSFPGSLDNVMNTGFSKQRINPNLHQSFYDKLKAICNPHIKQVRKKVRERQADKRQKKEDFSEIEKFITQKSHLLKMPQVEVESRRSPEKQEVIRRIKEDIEQRGPRLDFVKRKRINLDSVKVNFRTKSFTKTGPLFDSEMEGGVTVITWNIDHPFYTDMIVPNEENKDVYNSICFFVYSLATAELRSSINSDSAQMIENIRYEFSRNLAVLMGS